jgi:hypothetical protein
MRVLKFIFLFLLFTESTCLLGQVTIDNNNPFPGSFLGWNGAQDLDFRTNNINRMRLMETGTATIDGYNIDYDGHLGLSLTPSFFGTGLVSDVPFSLLHLNGFNNNANGPQQLGYRDWMRPGIIFTHNSDMMYVGPKVGPGGTDVTDAVIGWADNESSPGPDVLRFLFTGAGGGTQVVNTSNPLSRTDYDGVEIARMHGDGVMGVGARWTKTRRPKRTLDVVRRQDSLPQLRLTFQEAIGQFAGTYSEFQTSPDGNLHIVPFTDQSVQTVVIGFLNDEEEDPLGVDYRLEVGGVTRIRDLREDSSRLCNRQFYSDKTMTNALG